MGIIQALNGIFWGWLIAGVLLGAGILFMVRLRAPQLRYFTKMLSSIKHGRQADSGVSGFSALCAALGGQVGTGSLVGVAAALASGGPGAIFWMWVTSLLGMGVCFCEAVLAQLFRESNGDGTFRGGPAFYITKGMNNKVLAVCFSVSIIIAIGIFYAMIQSNSIALAATEIVDINPLYIGIGLAVVVAAVIFGGVKRLADVATYIVPFMAGVYILVTIIIIVMNLEQLPGVIALIFKSAFSYQSAAGGVIGHTVGQAFRYGIARGLFSNDAGTGTAPSMHATALVKHPINQGISAMLGAFFTTCVVCSCTAFSILLTGALGTGETGIVLTQTTFAMAVGDLGKYVVFFAIFFFGFTSLLADVYYGEVNIQWFTTRKGAITFYRIIACGIVILASVIPVNALWDFIDFTVAFMVFFNIVALVSLLKYVRYTLRDFEIQKKNGVEHPTWDYDVDITKIDIEKEPEFAHSPKPAA